MAYKVRSSGHIEVANCVSILVLMELAYKGTDLVLVLERGQVSILVLMELAYKDYLLTIIFVLSSSFNPCSNGIGLQR